ncbi:Dna polymerase alpha catalytic subunit [Thalictrum thalictroides]|uniref:DNA polymerase n=1 Tax=Thalictrum thalictroides TaxID=46969 RepID=A0A7J6VG87_THATH|nr:Dna polymerase alpha catalytic subunit [Thalictrum thalictroides]
MSEPIVGSRRRNKGPEASARANALERLKSIRSGGARLQPEIKVLDPIYDTVGEEDYAALKAKRCENAQGFIVDDDGLGYVDEGQEEDWTEAGVHSSSEDEESEQRRKKKKPEKEKKDPPPKKPSALSAAAALMGKQRISSIFTSSVFNKSKDLKSNNNSGNGGFSSDSIIDEVLAEIAPDENDRERRRRAKPGAPLIVIDKGLDLINSVKIENLNLPIVNGDSVVNNDVNVVANELPQINVEEKKELGSKKDMLMDWDDDATPNLLAESHNSADASSPKVSEMSVEILEKKDEGKLLNAKVNVEFDPALSATAGWKALRNGDSGEAGFDRNMTNSNVKSDEKPEFFLDSDGSLPFYIIDAYEEAYGNNLGIIYLFGKVKAGNTYHSCCAVVRNMQRCVYAFPRKSVFPNDVIMDLERDVTNSRISTTIFREKLLEMASGMKKEIANKLLDISVSTFSMAPVKRSYSFERPDISIGQQYVLKINYPFKDPPLPSDLKGEHFSALLGTYCSALEHFLIKRKIKGPSWLSISKFSNCPVSQRVSWCKFEVTVDCPKDIHIPSSSKVILEIPPVIVSAINLKTVINEKQNVNEIVSASVICCQKAKIDTPMLASEWKRPGVLSHFTVVRKLEGGIFPMGFTKKVTDRNSEAGCNVLGVESSERALLNRLMLELHKLDSDVLVGHNISGFDLDVLLHRAQACKVPSSMWSKIGRLKRSVMPKLTKGSSLFGSGASPGIMSCIAGRLLCDTYLCSRDLLKEVSYSLTQLAKSQLNKNRKEIPPHDIPAMLQSSDSLLELILYGETDAWLSMELMFHLSVLPLTRQLTNISGNLWGKTLQGARAQRVEYLLLHAFHAKKYIVPDKISAREKEANSKRRLAHGGEGGDVDDMNITEAPVEDGLQQLDQGKGKKGPGYAGGLVLEPKKGLYDKYILLLDFNSLYPSIIQEYNICFTTVERSADGTAPRLPSSKITGVLPELLRNLVERRKMVKSWLKTASGLKVQQLDIQQQALKLTANSMYGCLGFSNSRFYAKPLAELITLQGREILQSTVDLVQNNLNLEVIYGDTDSIMIYSGLDDIAQAKIIAGKVIQEVNKKYRCLEIDLDGLYKRMLLLKKKKYAAVKLQFKDGMPYEIIERKGLDMVRRDWSLLSKDLGDFCLSQILSGGSCEDVVESIHSSLMKVQEEMRNGEVPLEKYVITKTLTKPPEAYPDAKNQPHVQVALRLKQAGYSAGCSAGDTVPYVICCEQGTSSGSSTGIAQRARHPDELKKDSGNWMIDIEYYLAQQIHPVVSRLCASIQGTSPARLADCLGLDSSKFQSKISEAASNDPSTSLLSAVDDDERYRGCEPLRFSCPACSVTFECPTLSTLLLTSSGESSTEPQAEESSNNFWRKLHCPKCPDDGDGGRISPVMIANQVKRQVDGFISMYYRGAMTCDDETCKYTTRSLNLRVIGESERGTVCPNYPRCNGRLVRKYTEVDLYKQLSYFCYLLDVVRFIEKLDLKARVPLEKDLVRIRLAVDSAVSIVQKIRDRCSYGWVQMKDLSIVV